MIVKSEILDCGCDCSSISQDPDFAVELSKSEFQRLIEEKFERARRHRELMDRIDGQFETD